MGVNIKIRRGPSPVNGGGEEGGSDNPIVKLLKGLLKEFKGLTSMTQKAQKLSRSGLGGVAGGGFGAKMAAATPVGIIGGLIGGVAAGLSGSESPSDAMFGYEEALIEGERKFLKINQSTGVIQSVLSEQEAIQEGILDKAGNLLSKYTGYESEFDKMTKDLSRWRGAVVLNKESLDRIKSKNVMQELILDEINIKLRQQLSSMGGNSSRLIQQAEADAQAAAQQSFQPNFSDVAPFLIGGQSIDNQTSSDFQVKR